MFIIPKSPDENKRARLKFLDEARRKPTIRGALYRKCREDVLFFINLFCWTYDSRETNPHFPFILYPRQEAFVLKLEDCLKRSQSGEMINLLIDKPRDVGATFTFMVWLLHKYLFTEFSARVGSRKEDYVDKKGDVDTLFFKLDYNLERLPIWLTQGYDKTQHRASMLLKHPKTVSTITGESSNPDFGRGGRRSVILFDEMGFWEWSRRAWESSGSSTNFRVAMSTPPEDGRDSHWFKLISGLRGKVERFDFDWKDVPKRDEKWLQDAKENKSEEEFAREVLKSFDGTTEGKVYSNDMRLARIEEFEYNPSLPLFVSIDNGLDGTAFIWYQKDTKTNQIYAIDCYQNSNQEIGFYMPFVGHPMVSAYQYNSYDIEVIERHKAWRRDIIFCGDPAIKQRHDNNGESVLDILQNKYFIFVQHKDWAGRKWTDLRDITKPVFRRLTIHPRCEMLIYALRNARYPKKREGTQAVNAPLKPVHDLATSHLRSSWEYFCDNEKDFNFFPVQEENATEEPFNRFSIF